MNLKDLIKEQYPDGKLPGLMDLGMNNTDLTGGHLELLKEALLECEEFKYCDELIILDSFLTKDGTNMPIDLPTFKLIPGQYFKGKCYIYSIFLSPPMFIGKDLVKLVKDDAAISPTTYDENFKPNRRIILSFCPEQQQDSETLGQQNIRKELHEKLDKILDSPAEYQIEGERSVLIRGLFDVIVDNDGWERNLEIVHPITVDTENTFAYYLNPVETGETENGIKTVQLKLEKYLIPKNLEEKFHEKFPKGKDNISQLTKEQLDNFIEENK